MVVVNYVIGMDQSSGIPHEAPSVDDVDAGMVALMVVLAAVAKVAAEDGVGHPMNVMIVVTGWKYWVLEFDERTVAVEQNDDVEA